MTYKEAKERIDYHFSLNGMKDIIGDILKGWLESFEENGDPMRGVAVLEIGYVDIEVNIFSEEQLYREGIELPNEKRKAPVIDYFFCVKTGEDEDSWRDGGYLEQPVEVDWNAPDWETKLEQNMFEALNAYVQTAGYSYDCPNQFIRR